MWKKWILVFVALALMPRLGNGQDSRAVFEGVTKAMGDVKSLQYNGNGAYFFLGPERGSGNAVATLQPQDLHPDDQL